MKRQFTEEESQNVSRQNKRHSNLLLESDHQTSHEISLDIYDTGKN